VIAGAHIVAILVVGTALILAVIFWPIPEEDEDE
jgi:hypothetical protein